MNPLFDALFGRHAGRDAPFLICEGETVDYGAFVRRAGRYAAVLRAMGVAPGARLIVWGDKTADALALYAGCLQAGVVYLPLNPQYAPAEVAYFVENARPALMVVGDGAPPLAGLDVPVETQGTMAARADAAPDDAEVTARAEGDLAALLYTSGTTGRSKGAMLSHGNLLSNAEVLAQAWAFTEADVLLHALPIFHTHGLFVAVNTVALTGGALILLPRFEVGAVRRALPRATAMMGVPTFYTRLLADPDFGAEARHLRLVTSGSAPLRAETHAAFAARTGQAILERYGMTETNMLTSNPYDGARKPGTVGPPLPGVGLRIVDAAGAPVARGETGLIEVRGPGVFAGYWEMPEKTAAEMREDGFFVTGDLGMQDADGYVSIVGRAKDMVISGGLNVYPREVEAALDAQPGVAESAVIGVPHGDLGEAVVAVLVAEAGVALDPDAVAAGLGDLAGFKRPKRMVHVDALPRNAMGKVQKAVLRERFADLFA